MFPILDENFCQLLERRVSRILQRSLEGGGGLGGWGSSPGPACLGGARRGFFLLPVLFPLLIKFLCISLSGSKKSNRLGVGHATRQGCGRRSRAGGLGPAGCPACPRPAGDPGSPPSAGPTLGGLSFQSVAREVGSVLFELRSFLEQTLYVYINRKQTLLIFYIFYYTFVFLVEILLSGNVTKREPRVCVEEGDEARAPCR